MNLDYNRVTHEQLLDQFKNRLLTDPKYKNLSAAAIYQIYMEMMSGTFDMLHFYLGRTAEEMFFDSAKLDSSVIKLAKNLGYNPKRAIPATAEIAIKLQGPLPNTAAAGDVIWFNNETLNLSFNNKPYKLDRCYSYELQPEDIANGINNAAWSKTIAYSIPHEAAKGWIPLATNVNSLDRIRIIQCEIKTAEIYAVAHAENLGASYQFYDVDDVSFSNYYGIRDPFAYSEDIYTPLNGWCKVGIGLNKQDAFSEEKICDIEIENVYCNSKVKAANSDLTNSAKLNVCRIESNSDKTVRITFGDGTLVNNGFNNEDEILYVQYVSTDGYAANTPDVIGYTLDNASKIMAHAPGKLYDVTNNVTFVLTTNISNGNDFESKQQIKNNAAVYFAARGQLINKKDFTSYFSALSKPIQSKNAIAWTTTELAKSTDNTYEYIADNCAAAKNTVYYTIVGDLYESLGNDKYKVKELYTTTDASIVGNTTLYSNADLFTAHLYDLTKTFSDTLAAATEANMQATNRDDPFYLNTSSIYNDIEEKLPFGVVTISIPPIVQYFDLVGNVEIDRTANAADYQADVEAKLYKWLKDRQKFNNKIYKSDLIKLIYDNASTKSVNVDLTPSGLVRDTATQYGCACANTKTLYTSTNDPNCASVVESTDGYKNQVIFLPRVANKMITSPATNNTSTSVLLSEALLLSVDTIGIACKTDSRLTPNKSDYKQVSIQSITETNDGRFCITLQPGNYEFCSADDVYIWISIDDEVSTFYANCADTNAISVNIKQNNQQDEVNTKAYQAHATTETPVHLPYAATANDSVERKLDYYRNASKYSTLTINEKAFNLYYAVGKDATTYLEAYKCFKWLIEDSILDDNNNIVNYSLPNEISVVRVHLTYTYGR